MSNSEHQEQPQKIITYNNQEIIFTDAHHSLLECLESANVDVDYHCRDGYCGACRISLTQGLVNYPNGEPLAFVGDGEILPCCCIPHTNISITID